jgi:hypothetical protein
VNEKPPITPLPPRRRLTSTQIAALIQLAIAAALVIALALCAWWFFRVAERLGGVRVFAYLPIAMAAFMLFALYRLIQAWRMLRRRDTDHR